MRIIIVFILFLLLGVAETPSHQVAENLSVTSPQTTSESQYLGDSASFHESQIRIADSLYKNYLPQYNFDEVKAAMEFFDSIRNDELAIRNYGRRKAIPNSTFLIPNYQCAKAHYYHAVGLTEKDDIVGACEHYLIALEIMEDDDIIKSLRDTKTQRRKVLKKQRNDEKTLCDSVTLRLCDSDEDYEKIRFVYLINTRLGEFFYEANFCDISIINYKSALEYSQKLNDKTMETHSLKCIGQAYQLLNKADTALYYYRKSLKPSTDLYNKLDLEKCISRILFNNEEKDSAYILLKNNLNKINNKNVKYSYHYTLGDMFYIDKEYDSALYYLEESLDDSIITKKLAFITTLSAIYDSIGDYEKKAYYDNLSSNLFKNNYNKEIDKTQLQTLYNDYNKRKADKEITIAKKKARNKTIAIGIIVLVVVTFVIIYIRYNHKKQNDRLSEEIKAKDKHIKHNEFKNALIEGKIKSKNIELQQKDKQIKSQQLKIAELQSKLENRKDNLKEYYQSEICAKILNEINELSKANKMTSELKPLGQEEFVMLLQSANLHLGKFIKNTSDKYPSFKKDDLYYLCLVAINLNDKQIAALFNVTYNAVRSRRKKICSYLDIDINENIYKKLTI